MSEAHSIPIDTTGTIIAGGKYVGWNVRIERNGEGASDLLIYIWNGVEGYDDWVQSEGDLPAYLDESGWTVAWDTAPSPSPLLPGAPGSRS